MELKKLPYNEPKIPPNKTIGIRIRYSDGKILPLIKYPINPEIELTKINKAETAAVCFKVPHFNKTMIGLRIIPPPIPKKNWRDLIEKMSEISKNSYRKNINQSSDFIQYFRTVTPHKALGKLSIGSRPSKRKNVDNIKSLRAIPWVFAWTQIRLMLPAWLGSAEALRYSYIKQFRNCLLYTSDAADE